MSTSERVPRWNLPVEMLNQGALLLERVIAQKSYVDVTEEREIREWLTDYYQYRDFNMKKWKEVA